MDAPRRRAIDLAAWIIQIGNDPDVERGQTAEFAIEFWPVGELKTSTAGTRSARWTGLARAPRSTETGQVSVEETALIVVVPEAEPAVGQYRAALDSGAAVGVPAHITVLYPFIPTNGLSPEVIGQLRDLFGAVDAFEISLTSIGWFDDDVVFVRPEPDAALRRLTSLVAERWPQRPPYGGAHPDPTPHLTIADNGDLPAMRRAAHAVQPFLPLHVEVTEVQLHAGTAQPGTWRHRLTFPLRMQHP